MKRFYVSYGSVRTHARHRSNRRDFLAGRRPLAQRIARVTDFQSWCFCTLPARYKFCASFLGNPCAHKLRDSRLTLARACAYDDEGKDANEAYATQ